MPRSSFPQWTIKLGARTEWDDVEALAIARLTRHVVGLTIHEEQVLLAKLPRRSIQARVAEQMVSVRMRSDLLRLQSVRGRCTRVLQTVFITAAKIKFCDCKGKEPFKGVIFSPVSDFLTNHCISQLLRSKPNSRLLFLW